MEINFQEASEKLKNIILKVKECLSIGDASIKVAKFEKIITDFFPNPTECDYYLTLIEIFTQVAEILNTSEGKEKSFQILF